MKVAAVSVPPWEGCEWNLPTAARRVQHSPKLPGDLSVEAGLYNVLFTVLQYRHLCSSSLQQQTVPPACAAVPEGSLCLA